MRDINFIMPKNDILALSAHLKKAVSLGQKLASKKDRMFLLRTNMANQMQLDEFVGAVTYGLNTSFLKMTMQEEEEQAFLSEEQQIRQEMEQLLLEVRKMDKNVLWDEKEEAELERSLRRKDCIGIIYFDENDILKGYPSKHSDMFFEKPQFEAFVIHCNKNSLDREMLENFRKLCELGKAYKKWIFIEVDKNSEQLVSQLLFEFDTEIIDYIHPDFSFYKNMFLHKLKKNGIVLENEETVEETIQAIRTLRGDLFRLDDFDKVIWKYNNNDFAWGDLQLLTGKNYVDPEKQLNNMIGLNYVKSRIDALIKLSQYEMKRFGFTNRNNHNVFAFAGNPGTGKTEVANLYAKIMRKYGIASGEIIIAKKSDYIGQYVGHTCAQIKELFQKAQHGVLVFDEAAALLTEDVFSQEAITEIVRFLDLCSDVTVIFSSYKDKITQLMEKDAGLRSRMKEVLLFEDYTNEELYAILEKFCKSEGYQLEDSRDVFFQYVDGERKKYPDSFGNGRLSRNIFDKSKEAMAVEFINLKKEPSTSDCIQRKHVKAAIAELERNGISKEETYTIGFTRREMACQTKI